MKRTTVLRTASLVAAIASLGAAPAAQAAHHAHAKAPVKPGIYDCWSQFGTTMSYLVSYQIEGGGRYGVGSRLHGNKLQGKIDWGRYRTKGRWLIPTSGVLKKQHYYLHVEKPGEVALFHTNRKPTGVGCYLHKR